MDSKLDPNETKQQARKRTRSARAIGESEEWLFTALQSIGDAVIATDAAGLIVFMNLVAVKLTGWSEEEAQGVDCREVFRIVSESTRLESESPITKVLRDGIISGLANYTILIARDGTEHHIDDSGSPILDKAGNLIGVVLIFRDVTERRKSEQARQEQQAILQTLFDHIPVIITFMDEEQQLKWVNREWMRVIGWSLAEMREIKGLALFSPLLLEAEKGALTVETPTAGWRDLTLTAKAGNVVDLAWATVRLSDGSSIGIGQDITQRKRAEALIGQHTAQIETYNRRLELAMLETQHRVKNNLQLVAAMLDLQVLEHKTMVPVQELRQVHRHIVTLADIHDLLLQNVNEAGVVEALSAREALQGLLPMLQELVGEQRMGWSIEEVQLPIKQSISLGVLINELVTNAIKHGGHNVQLRLVLVEQDVMLEVCDDGPGFSEGFRADSDSHFGLEMVESVGRLDLGAETTYANRPEGGASVRVIFPLPMMPEALAS